jgi:uncharacterized membrane protein YphA (DoxX/SURF4 family)
MDDLALLILRLSLAWVFLYAGYRNVETEAARTWLVSETALLFAHVPEDKRLPYAEPAAYLGAGVMLVGGAGIALGIEPRLCGVALAVFSFLGMLIHHAREREAQAAGMAGNAMGWSGFGAHIAAGLKNWALAGAGIAIALMGAGAHGLGVDFTGRWLGLTP